ncbi:hypothetical protein ABZ916_25650 [Streptomyces sp. NPDC046853]|uniref:hypothetical protein n=1 Tax=Streptomyces sp. NPDC046853 TaxID=3154920 RepID=UPI0033E4B808
MAKLPDNDVLRGLFRDGLTDKQIAAAYGCSIAAVNARFQKMGLQRKPFSNTATAILEAGWPAKEFSRSRFNNQNTARTLYAFLRWRLGDPTLTTQQLARVRVLASRMEAKGTILELAWDEEGEQPWTFVPRKESDGRLVVRWPEGRELPKGPHLDAITLPPVASETQEVQSAGAN